MAEFIQKNRSGTYKIYQAAEIEEWFEGNEIAPEVQEPLKVIKEHIGLPNKI